MTSDFRQVDRGVDDLEGRGGVRDHVVRWWSRLRWPWSRRNHPSATVMLQLALLRLISPRDPAFQEVFRSLSNEDKVAWTLKLYEVQKPILISIPEAMAMLGISDLDLSDVPS